MGFRRRRRRRYRGVWEAGTERERIRVWEEGPGGRERRGVREGKEKEMEEE